MNQALCGLRGIHETEAITAGAIGAESEANPECVEQMSVAESAILNGAVMGLLLSLVPGVR